MDTLLQDQVIPLFDRAVEGYLIEIDDAQLAMIGGGIGDVVPA